MISFRRLKEPGGNFFLVALNHRFMQQRVAMFEIHTIISLYKTNFIKQVDSYLPWKYRCIHDAIGEEGANRGIDQIDIFISVFDYRVELAIPENEPTP